jgi:hypothetical protein
MVAQGNLDPESCTLNPEPSLNCAAGMVAQGKVQTAKELLVGDVSLSYKYKYSAKVMEVDATWDIKPARAASTSMWVAIFKEGAPLTEVCVCVCVRVCV